MGVRPSLNVPEPVSELKQEPPDDGPLPGALGKIGAEGTLGEQLRQERATAAALLKENRFIRRMLDDRDRQFAALQAEYAAMRRYRVWRIIATLRGDLRRFRRQFRSAART